MQSQEVTPASRFQDEASWQDEATWLKGLEESTYSCFRNTSVGSVNEKKDVGPSRKSGR